MNLRRILPPKKCGLPKASATGSLQRTGQGLIAHIIPCSSLIVLQKKNASWLNITMLYVR